MLCLGGLAAWLGGAADPSTAPPFVGLSTEADQGKTHEVDAPVTGVDLSDQATSWQEHADGEEARRVRDVTREPHGEARLAPGLMVEVVDRRGFPASLVLVEIEGIGDAADRRPAIDPLRTGPDGRALFEAWPAASFRIVVTPEEPTDADEAPLLDAEKSVDPAHVARSTPVRIELDRAARIVGTLDCSDGSSPRSSGIDVFHLESRSWTNAAAIENGSFTSQWMLPGDVIIYARNGRWTETDLRLRRPFTLAEGQSHGFHGTLEPALVLEGTTVDATGRPAPGHTVTVVEIANRGNERSATSDEEGRFRVEGLHATDYDLGLLTGDQDVQRITLQRGSESTQAAPLVVRP